MCVIGAFVNKINGEIHGLLHFSSDAN